MGERWGFPFVLKNSTNRSMTACQFLRSMYAELKPYFSIKGNDYNIRDAYYEMTKHAKFRSKTHREIEVKPNQVLLVIFYQNPFGWEFVTIHSMEKCGGDFIYSGGKQIFNQPS